MTPKPDLDLDAIKADILEALAIGEAFACVEGNDEQLREVQAAPAKLSALVAEVREARKAATRTAIATALAAVDAEIDLTEHVGILRALGKVRARIKQSATVVGVATTVPDETLRAHEPAPCPGCAGDLAGLVDAVCPTCRAALTVAFAVEVPRG